MNNFKFAGFGWNNGESTKFVANANRYTKNEVLDLLNREFSYLYLDQEDQHNDSSCELYPGFRKPTIDDVYERYCVYRFEDVSFPDGGYKIVDAMEYGAFPVYVIDIENLKVNQIFEPCNPKEFKPISFMGSS